MRSVFIVSRVAGVVASTGMLLLASACGASRPATAPLAPNAPTTTSTQATGQTSTSTAPSAGTITVSDEIRRACGLSDHDAYFPYDSAALESQDIAPLTAIARCFSSGPLKGRTMVLVGRADPRGPTDYNLSLGQRRADSVEKYLDRHGVDHTKMDTSSRGAMDATGSDEAGWAKDRRVDVMLGS
jgi:peptidoglycan-associated lipoprotein